MPSPEPTNPALSVADLPTGKGSGKIPTNDDLAAPGVPVIPAGTPSGSDGVGFDDTREAPPLGANTVQGAIDALKAAGATGGSVAPNEFYIDQTAPVSAAARKYQAIGPAVVYGQANFPAGTAIVIRCCEFQNHAWDPSQVDEAFAGTHPVVIYTTQAQQFQRFNGDFAVTINSAGPAAGGESITFKNVSMNFSAPMFIQDWLDTILVFEDVVIRNNTGAVIVIKAAGLRTDVAAIEGVQFRADSVGAVPGEGLHMRRTNWSSGLLGNASSYPLFDSNQNATFEDMSIDNFAQGWTMFRATGVGSCALRNVSIHAQNGVIAPAAFFDVPVASLNALQDVRVNLEDTTGPVTWGLPNANTSGTFWLMWSGAQPADIPFSAWINTGNGNPIIQKP